MFLAMPLLSNSSRRYWLGMEVICLFCICNIIKQHIKRAKGNFLPLPVNFSIVGKATRPFVYNKHAFISRSGY